MDTTKSVFACNPRLKSSKTGEIEKKYHRGHAEPGTAEQILGMLEREDLPKMLSEIRDEGKEEVKDQLPTICPHYSQFRNNHRAQADIIPEAFTYKTCNDIDEESLVEQAIKRALEVNEDEYSEFQGMVEYIDYSPRKKCHIWLRMPVGKTIEETQKAFCDEIGVPYDESCTTPERYINMTGDEVYRSERWLQPLSDEEIEERREAFLQRGLDVDGRPLKKPETAVAPAVTTHPTGIEVVAANDRTRFIVRECLKEAGLTVNDLNEVGGRHNSVKSILSVGATQLLTQGEFIGVMQEMASAYSQEKEFRQLVSDFYAKYTDDSQKLTQFQRRVFAASRKVSPAKMAVRGDVQEEETSEVVYGDSASLADIYGSPTPPQLSNSAKPRFVKDATGPVPVEAKETASQAMFPPLGMYCDAKFVYTDNTYREPRSNCLIIAGTGGGKDSSTKHMLKHLEMPQKQEDGPNRVILEKYKRECNRRNQNLDKPERPNVAVKSVPADITKARLSELMADSQGNIVHTRMVELDQWFAVEGYKPGPNCPFTYMKMTDDEDNPFGQERVGSQSVTYQGPLSINWNASTTPSKAAYYFRNAMTDGPISRLVLATVPDRGLGAPMPVHGKYDEKYDAKLKPYIDNLRQAHGVIDCRQARRMAERLKDELDDFVVKSGDDVLNNLGRRALVAAFRKSCLLYAANGKKWEKNIEGFCRWSLHYDLWLKLHFFSDLIRHADSQVKTSKRGPANLMEQIAPKVGDVFDMNALVCARLKNGMKEEGTNNMLSQWKKRHLIEEMDDGRFRRINPEKDDK
jgi:hypothetical protein